MTDKTKTDKTKVVFRVWPDGQVIALFPDIVEGYGKCLSYEHVGQHGAASVWVTRLTKRATPEQYKALKEELESIGYDLVVRSRI